ncbi:MAG: fumarylacetoacetate hydrolase family protein [Deinococcales bacterium]
MLPLKWNSKQGPWRLGVYVHGHQDRVIDIARAAEALRVEVVTTPEDLYREGLRALPALQALLSKRALSAYSYGGLELTLAPPIQSPGKILCVGLNYRRHAAESGMAEPKEPVLFSKFNNALAATGQPVKVSGLEQSDYESELAVIIGREGKNIPESEALDYVLGYANANDVSDRKLQFLSGQWLLGKTLDGFLPIGPYVVTADEVDDPQKLSIKGWLNGELRQNSNTADMIFSVAQIIAYASRYMTLNAGDVIITGTPEGVILGMKDKQWLKAGDSYTVEIEKLGRLETPFT